MKSTTALPVVILTICGALGSGCLNVEQLTYEHDNPETYAGPVDQRTQTGDVSTGDIDAEVNADVDTQVESDAEVSVGTAPGGNTGGTTALGDGVAFTYVYEGPLFERVTLTPDAPALQVESVEWLLRSVSFGEATIFDDPAGFLWGEPQYADDEFVLAALFGERALDPVVWDASSAFCTGDACFGRAIEAACEADVVLRVWLADGSTREAVARHVSERVICPS